MAQDRNSQSQEGTVPEEAVEALALELAAETGARTIKDGAGTYDMAKLDRARRLLKPALPSFEKHFADRLKEVERQRDSIRAERNVYEERAQKAEASLAGVGREREELRSLAITNGGEAARHAERADRAEAALAERDRQVRDHVLACLREARREAECIPVDPERRDAMGRATPVVVAAFKELPSSTPLQQDPKSSGVGEDARDRFTHGDLGGLLEAVRYRVANDLEIDKHPGMARRYDEIEGKLTSALIQPEADPEVPRCGGRAEVERVLSRQIVVNREIQDREFARRDGDPSSAEVRADAKRVAYEDALSLVQAHIPADCQSTPELLGEAVRVSWPETEAGEGKRIERIVLALEYEVWEAAGLSREQLVERLLDALPIIIPAPDSSDEAAELQQAESVPFASKTARVTGEQRGRGCATNWRWPRKRATVTKLQNLRQALDRVATKTTVDDVHGEYKKRRPLNGAECRTVAADALKADDEAATQPVPGNSGGVEEGRFPFEREPAPRSDGDWFNLCGNCGGIAHQDDWKGYTYDEEADRKVEYTGTDEAPYWRCPLCRHDHTDDDSGAGVWDGTRDAMLGERRRLLSEDEGWRTLWTDAASNQPSSSRRYPAGLGLRGSEVSVEAELRESLTWALTWIVGEGRMPSDMGGLPSDQEAFDEADRLVSGTGKQSPAEPQDAKRLRQIADAVEKNAPEWLLSSTPVFLRRLADETPPWGKKKAPAEPQGGVVEKVASDIAIWLGDDLLRRAGLESAPQELWSTPGFERTREEAAWLKGRDDTVAFVQDELEGCIRRALEESPAITPLLSGSSYVRERVTAAASEALGRLVAYADYSRAEEDEELVRKALSGHVEEEEMSKKPSRSLGVIDHLRKEGEARSDLADGPIASLQVYAESNDEEVAKAAKEALAALDKEDSR